MSSIKYQCGWIKSESSPCISTNFELPTFANMNILNIRTMLLHVCHRNENKNKSKVRFVESSFGQKVWSTFPIAHCRILRIPENRF